MRHSLAMAAVLASTISTGARADGPPPLTAVIEHPFHFSTADADAATIVRALLPSAGGTPTLVLDLGDGGTREILVDAADGFHILRHDGSDWQIVLSAPALEGRPAGIGGGPSALLYGPPAPVIAAGRIYTFVPGRGYLLSPDSFGGRVEFLPVAPEEMALARQVAARVYQGQPIPEPLPVRIGHFTRGRETYRIFRFHDRTAGMCDGGGDFCASVIVQPDGRVVPAALSIAQAAVTWNAEAAGGPVLAIGRPEGIHIFGMTQSGQLVAEAIIPLDQGRVRR